ncbi:MAG: amidohydrolase [Nitrospirae bacterium]|nr:amidohydrolase [Nitrospirota bacterium]
MIPCDIIIKADHILTMNDGLDVIQNGAIAVMSGKIIALGGEDLILREYSAGKVIGGNGTVAFPGLVNAHTHSPMVYFRGLEDDLPLKVWLEEHIWPAEEKWLSPQFVSDAAELACIEMLKAGITAFCDMYFYGDEIARAVRKTGMRAVVCSGIVDFPGKTGGSADDYLKNAESFINNWKDDDFVTPGVAPHAPYTCSPETLIKSKTLADKYSLPLHLHLSETQWEVGEVKKRYGKTPVSLLEDIGVLDDRVIAAHCVWPTEQEIAILARRRVGVVHCMESNLKLASGIAPVVSMLKAGCRVSLGTDGAASNNDLDILSEMATAAKVHKAVSSDPTVLNARQAMLMATRVGAETLGLGGASGSLEAGKSADIVIADLKGPHMVPLYDIYSHIVYSMNRSDISTVIINGRVLMEDRRLTSADEAEIINRAASWGRKIRSDRQ